MKNIINQVTVKGLFEEKNNYRITFDSGINCLFGENGTGKTTLINLIVAVLSGDIDTLTDTNFNSIEITIKKGDIENDISVYKKPIAENEFVSNFIKQRYEKFDENQMKFIQNNLNLSTESQESSDDFSGPWMITYVINDENFSFLDPSVEKYSIFGKYETGSQNYKSLSSSLAKLINLTHVPLLRAKAFQSPSLNKHAGISFKDLEQSKESSRFDASSIVLREIEESFIKLASDLTRIDNAKLETFKSTIIQKFLVGKEILDASFETPFPRKNSDKPAPDELAEQLKQAGLDVPVIKLQENSESLTTLNNHLNEMIKTRDNIEKDKTSNPEDLAKAELDASKAFFKLLFAENLFKRFESILDDVGNLQMDRSRLWNTFEDYERLVNKFLNNKTFSLNRDGSFEVTTKNRKVELKNLSSGEKHIIALLGRAALSRDKGSVFIADEPELSLHLTWQRMMLPSIMELSPKSQVIVATHSPAIIPRDSNKIDLGEVVDG